MINSTPVLTLPVCSGIPSEVHKLARCKARGGTWGIEEKHYEIIFRNLKFNCLKVSQPQFASFLFLSYIRLRNIMLVPSLCLTVRQPLLKKGPDFVRVILKSERIIAQGNFCISKSRPNQGGNEVVR